MAQARRAQPRQTAWRRRKAKPRDLGLSFKPVTADEYECTVWGAVYASARLPLTRAELASLIEATRSDLLSVVMLGDPSGYPFERSVRIDPDAEATALRTLAHAGYRLFRTIFEHPAAGEEARRIGRYLQAQATGGGRLNSGRGA